jgi:hypothetical protein
VNNRSPRVLKWGWALGLSASVGMLLMGDRNSQWFPVLNFLIDSIQHQLNLPAPHLPATGEIPTGSGPFNLPALKKVFPAAADGVSPTPPDVPPANQ